MVSGGLGHPHGTVMVCSMTQAAVTHVLQMSVVDTAAGQPETTVGAVVSESAGEVVLAREELVALVSAGGFCCAWMVVALGWWGCQLLLGSRWKPGERGWLAYRNVHAARAVNRIGFMAGEKKKYWRDRCRLRMND